jgi:erythronate-4-phosphate dehydrogenase
METLGNSLSVVPIGGRDITNSVLKSGQYDALIVRSITKVNEELLRNTNVSFAGTATSGTDHIDTTYLESAGISFYSAPGSNANSVAEYVVFSILDWGKSNGILVDGKTIGIVGFGNIGKIVADYAHRMGLIVLVNDPPQKDAGFGFPDYVSYAEFDELICSSDIITNHVPLEKSSKYPTEKMFSNDVISSIKSNALFIHTSRGLVVDETALLKRLAMRDITAVVDVWENEPLANDYLVKYCQLATPHIAGYSYDGKLKGALMMAKAIENQYGIVVNTKLIEDELMNVESRFKVNSQHGEIYQLLLNSRKLNDDCLKFIESMHLDETGRRREFDKLRKEYPIRRENLF